MKYLKKIQILFFITIVSLFIIGCSGRPIHIESVSPKLYEKEDGRYRTVNASASGFQLLLFIPIDINDRHQRAYSMLKSQAGSDYLTDVTIKESWTWALVGTVYKVEMTGKVYRRD